MRHQYPKDLAAHVRNWLAERDIVEIDLRVIEEICDVLFLASLQTEEGESVRCSLSYVDPSAVVSDTGTTGRTHGFDRWAVHVLDKPEVLEEKNVVKLAKAIDPLFTTAAVYPNEQNLPVIWGITDQTVNYHRYVSHDREYEPEVPGYFHITVDGVGSLSAYCGYSLIASLVNGQLISQFDDVLNNGPVAQKLYSQFDDKVSYDNFSESLSSLTDDERDFVPWGEQYHDFLCFNSVSAISRILLRMQRYRHGGAIIISPNPNRDHLEMKYGFTYSRLGGSIERNTRNWTMREYGDTVHVRHAGAGLKSPPLLQIQREEFAARMRESESEVEGCVALAASLTRVDGALVLNSSMEILGFGTEIRTKDDDIQGGLCVFLARDPLGNDTVELKHDRYGTRHRSMMRYCAFDSECVGFVVSQDGAVSAFTKVGSKLVMWKNVRLKYNREYSVRRKTGN